METLPLLIRPDELDDALAGRDAPRVIDCQASLADPDAGRRAWLEGHIPGAVHLDLETDLSAPRTEATGRHPLPSPGRLRGRLGVLGITPDQPVVVYDDAGGAFAVRCWWLLRWLGHREVAVLDGGLSAWKAAGGRVEDGEPEVERRAYRTKGAAMPEVGSKMVRAAVAVGRIRLIDARGAPRFRGEEEPIDPVAGHVPGAVNRPFTDNLDEQGRWRSPDALRQRFEPLLAGFEPEQAVHMCGSGVTACHNLFAMELAGLTGSALYAGSWSEWIRDPERPVAEGDE